MEFINKAVPIKELVLKNTLIFLIKAYLKLVLDNLKEVGHCKINFCDIGIKLHSISDIRTEI